MKVKQTISIDKELLKDIKHRAIDEYISLSEYIERAIRGKIEKDDEE